MQCTASVPLPYGYTEYGHHITHMLMINDPSHHLKAVLEHPYQPDVCFICATKLTDANRTTEHVIPKWLQERFDLWRDELVLLNKTSIRYEQLKIPCCFECNNKRLSPLENRVASAITEGFDSVVRIPRFELFRWIAKIYLGILCKELSLQVDRRNRDLGTILTPDFVRRYAILHFWLQLELCASDPSHCPGSLWVFRCQVPENVDEQFDLMDDALNGVIAIRMGSVAIIADFLENGVHQELNAERTLELSKIALHPLQFTELVAYIVYEAKLLCQQSEIEFIQSEAKFGYRIKWWSTVEGDSTMKPWDRSDFAKILSHFTGIPHDSLYRPPDGLTTWLHNPYGDFVFWPLGQPHPFAGQDQVPRVIP